MSMTRMFWIICDECGHSGEDDGLYGHYSGDVREDAKEEGWRIGNKDICPVCLGTQTDE
jgi:hypothetical protein